MSDTAVNAHDCTAWGCPMLGTSSRSTTGGEWCCFIHVRADKQKWQSISAELNRLSWLVGIVRGIRAYQGTEKIKDFAKEARKTINISQRNDLQRLKNESATAWMIRLENVLSSSCIAANEQKQTPMPQEEPAP